MHTSTYFTPFFLKFGQEAHVHTDILKGRAPGENPQKAASFALSQCKNLDHTWSFVRNHLRTSQKRMKERYQLGVNRKRYRPGDKFRVRLKARQAKASKLRSPWSDLHNVISCHDVVVTLRNPSTNEIIKVSADRMSNSSHNLRHEPPFQPLFDVIIEQPEPKPQPLTAPDNRPCAPNFAHDSSQIPILSEILTVKSLRDSQLYLSVQALGKEQYNRHKNPIFFMICYVVVSSIR